MNPQLTALKPYLKISPFIIAVILALLLMAILMFISIQQHNKCIKNPFVYGAKEMSKVNNKLLCSCDLIESPGIRVYFDENGVYDKNPLISNELNLSQDIYIKE